MLGITLEISDIVEVSVLRIEYIAKNSLKAKANTKKQRLARH